MSEGWHTREGRGALHPSPAARSSSFTCRLHPLWWALNRCQLAAWNRHWSWGAYLEAWAPQPVGSDAVSSNRVSRSPHELCFSQESQQKTQANDTDHQWSIFARPIIYKKSRMRKHYGIGRRKRKVKMSSRTCHILFFNKWMARETSSVIASVYWMWILVRFEQTVRGKVNLKTFILSINRLCLDVTWYFIYTQKVPGREFCSVLEHLPASMRLWTEVFGPAWYCSCPVPKKNTGLINYKLAYWLRLIFN